MNAPAPTLGRYELLRVLASGADAQIYDALDPLLERRVALKVLHPRANNEQDTEYTARFLDEVRSCGALNHPNIVTVYDAGSSDGTPFIAMELLDGQSLQSLLQMHGALALELALDIAEQVAEALAFAHEQGIVHRDVKPGNITVLPDGVVKLTDFGLARRRLPDPSVDSGTGEGSPRYMSPEQALRKRAEPQSDLFSLGVVFYEMLTGRPPFDGDNLNAILFQIVNVAPPVPSTVDETLPEMIDFIVAKLLAKSPDDRYRSAREIADDLRQCRVSLDAPAPLSTLDIFKPSSARIDPRAVAPLLLREDPETRAGDHDKSDADPLQTGLHVVSRFDAHSETVRVPSHTEQLTAPTWSRRDWTIFAAGVAAAAMVSGLILIV